MSKATLQRNLEGSRSRIALAVFLALVTAAVSLVPDASDALSRRKKATARKAAAACMDSWYNGGADWVYRSKTLWLAECCHGEAVAAGEARNDAWIRECENAGAAMSDEASSIQSTVESFTDRPAQDYRSFNTNDRRVCENQCLAESQCASWTYVEPGVQGTSGRCWLKHSVPGPRNSEVCTSGVKFSVEPGINRGGKDYKHFSIPASHPDGEQFCRTVCIGEAPRCRAWTYVEPGYQGADAACWLKDRVPAASANECCSSGVVGEMPAN
jgi:hypothetical protein